MTYRDENAALGARVDELEGRLADANARIAALSGSAPPADVASGETLGPVTRLGVPAAITLETELDYTLTPAGYEAIADLLRKRLKLRVSQVGTSLDSGDERFRVTVAGGRTRIALRGDWSASALAPVIASRAIGALLSFFTGAVVVAIAHDVGHVAEPLAAMQFLWAGPLAYGIVSTLTRGRFDRTARTQVEAGMAGDRGAFAAILELADKHRATTVRARVEVDVDDEAERAEAEPNESEASPARDVTRTG